MTTPGEPFDAQAPGHWPAAQWPAAQPAPVRPGRVAGLGVAAVFAVAGLGVPLGLLWSVLAPDVPVRVTADGLMFAQAQPEQPVAADVWFVLLSAPFGVLVALAGWAALRRLRGPVGLLSLTVGALVAGPVAWALGRRMGLADFHAAAAQAPPGTVLGQPADLRVLEADWWPPMLSGVPVVPALAVAAAYTMLAAWSRHPDLRGAQ